ncbi:vasorin-like [Chironomus tepperi]|uniref:vasorin-like n=1 Tax=Chironomus tepperi TaxID=113505 RepID=UPI00391F3049
MRVNNLREITSQSFKGLMMLEELYLSENAIFDIERDSFQSMENLHTIDLTENCIFRIKPYIFLRNYRLIDIYLNYNYLNELPILMPSSQFIRNLNVTGNRLTNMTSLLYYKNIQSLDLSENTLIFMNIAGQMNDSVEKESDGSFISSSESEYDNNDEGNMQQHRRQRAPFSFQHPENPMNRRVNSNIDDRLSNPLPDSVGMRYKRAAARTSIDIEYNSNIQYLMDIFRPGRISEEAIQSLIKISLNENVSENLKVMIDVAIDYYKNQNPYRFRHEISKINDNEEA